MPNTLSQLLDLHSPKVYDNNDDDIYYYRAGIHMHFHTKFRMTKGYISPLPTNCLNNKLCGPSTLIVLINCVGLPHVAIPRYCHSPGYGVIT